jgi:hypothetical protein
MSRLLTSSVAGCDVGSSEGSAGFVEPVPGAGVAGRATLEDAPDRRVRTRPIVLGS